MALSLGSHPRAQFLYAGTLARVPLVGGAPREIRENVEWADWSPDGNTLAIVREVEGRERLEFPPDKVLYQADGWIGHLRISPKADMIAFIDHLQLGDDGGAVAVVDMAGKKNTLFPPLGTILGGAGVAGGAEVCVSPPPNARGWGAFFVHTSGAMLGRAQRR